MGWYTNKIPVRRYNDGYDRAGDPEQQKRDPQTPVQQTEPSRFLKRYRIMIGLTHGENSFSSVCVALKNGVQVFLFSYLVADHLLCLYHSTKSFSRRGEVTFVCYFVTIFISRRSFSGFDRKKRQIREQFLGLLWKKPLSFISYYGIIITDQKRKETESC